LPDLTSSENQDNAESLSVYANKMLSLNSQLQEKRSQFLRGVTNNLEDVKITTALQQFNQMDFAEFMKELKKQKITIPLKQQSEWEDFFNDCVAECRELSAQIKATDEEIDNKVFDLYGLTEEERRIVMDA
jgi:predicted TIM-barrel fold metal-dependent hydrolase